MGKNSKTKNFCKQKKNNKIIHNSLHLVSPFHFTNRNNFIYNIKLYKEFIKFQIHLMIINQKMKKYYFLNIIFKMLMPHLVILILPIKVMELVNILKKYFLILKK